MALQVWLPLNGDLHNQGLNQKIIPSTLGTVSYDNNGKIGKCFISGGTSQLTNGISLNTNFINMFNNENGCSIAVWIKPVGNHFHYNGTIVSSGNWNSQCWSFGVSQDNTKVDVLCKGYNAYISCNIPVNEWTHLVGTYKNGISKIYKNGIYIGELTGRVAFNSDASNTCIGRETYANGYFGFNGRINDVRIYDHCLSPKEVKELSKGLVLHYKLDDIGSNTNLLPVSSQRLSINGTTSSNEYMNLCSTLQIYETYGLVPYTISFEIKAAVPHSFSIYGNYGSNPKYSFSSKSINVTTEWQRFSHTFIPILNNSSGTWAGISVYGVYGSGAIVSVRNVKFELGIKATPITNRTNIIYDCSGYENDGIIIGTLNINNDSPRYNYSLGFNGNSCINVGQSVKVKDEISVCCWAYMSNWSNYTSMRLISCTESGGWTFYCPSSAITFYIGTGVSSNTYKYAGNMNVSSLAPGWHYFVGTYNGLEIKLYIDGVLNATTTAYSTKTPIYYYPNNGIFVGAEAGSNTTTPAGNYFNGYLSDVRIYCTALLDSDILELYNNPANIDNQGNMFSFEFDEEEVNKQQILKTGITKINNFIEINNKIKVLDDGSVFLQILHHNNPASNLFTVSNCWLNNDENLYSALILLKNIFKNFTEYEFLACEKAESSTTSETQFRWKQTSNPALSSTITGKTIISGSVTYNQGLKTNGRYAAMHNGSTWWCACGSYTAYSGGIPGFNVVIKSGYLDLYIRISEEMLKGEIGDNLKIFKKSILSTKIIEK